MDSRDNADKSKFDTSIGDVGDVQLGAADFALRRQLLGIKVAVSEQRMANVHAGQDQHLFLSIM